MRHTISRAEQPNTSQRPLGQQGERQVQPVWRYVHALHLLTAAYAQVTKERRDVAEPKRTSGYSAELKPPSASQRQEQYARDLCKHPSVNQTFHKAAKPEGLQSQDSQQEGPAIQSDTGAQSKDGTSAQSEDDEDFEEREDDRANDPACIQCDDGGALLTIVWTSCLVTWSTCGSLAALQIAQLFLTTGSTLFCMPETCSSFSCMRSPFSCMRSPFSCMPVAHLVYFFGLRILNHCVTGTVMFCDGSCMRAFHCGVERLQHDSSSDSDMESHDPALADCPTKLQQFPCNPLDMPLDLYQHLKDTKDTFHCPNCLAGVHQCFKCKLEGVVEAHAADPHNTRFANQLVYRY